jgi:hypothetical protein
MALSSSVVYTVQIFQDFVSISCYTTCTVYLVGFVSHVSDCCITCLVIFLARKTLRLLSRNPILSVLDVGFELAALKLHGHWSKKKKSCFDTPLSVTLSDGLLEIGLLFYRAISRNPYKHMRFSHRRQLIGVIGRITGFIFVFFKLQF